jgi:thiamine-phosphate pyrophosphorylase
MEMSKKIAGGIYLVIDPGMERQLLFHKLKAALEGGIDVLQIWNHWPEGINKLSFIQEISALAKPYHVPLLINQEWALLNETSALDGVHFDAFPVDLPSIKQKIGKAFIAGVTCSGNLETVIQAHQNQLDYISFCSMFPSRSAGSCTIVLPKTVEQAGKLTDIPLFISGGITPENTATLKQKIDFDGVAVISGILNAKNPKQQTLAYQDALNKKQ